MRYPGVNINRLQLTDDASAQVYIKRSYTEHQNDVILYVNHYCLIKESQIRTAKNGHWMAILYLEETQQLLVLRICFLRSFRKNCKTWNLKIIGNYRTILCLKIILRVRGCPVRNAELMSKLSLREQEMFEQVPVAVEYYLITRDNSIILILVTTSLPDDLSPVCQTYAGVTKTS